MARDPKKPLDVVQAENTPGTPLALDGTKLGESQIATEATTKDEVPVVNAPPVVDTSVLAENDPKGDLRPGVIPDTFAQGIDPASNRKVEEMDGRMPVPPPTVAPSSAASLDALSKAKTRSGVEIRLKADYWPMQRPDGFPEDQDYRLPAGTTLKLPMEEAMDLCSDGKAERVKP